MIHQRIQHVTRQLNNWPGLIVAVSKYAQASDVQAVYQAGLRCFGENKVQALQQRQKELPQDVWQKSQWHFLGHLQKNKVKALLQLRPALIHSVDSEALALCISQHATALGMVQPVLLQLNATGEAHKNGFDEATLFTQFQNLCALPGLEVCGLMVMGPNPPAEHATRACFTHVHDVRGMLQKEFSYPLKHLSMGMSQDYMLAIESGATIIRIGRSIFEAG